LARTSAVTESEHRPSVITGYSVPCRLGVTGLGMCESALSGQIGPFWIME
jgi:hypothetical protein